MMIAEAVFIMTILGCGNEGDACDFVAEPQTTYASRIACETAVQSVLPTYQAVAYPVLIGDCSEKADDIQIVQLADDLTVDQLLSRQSKGTEMNTFEQLRARAEAFEFDPFEKVNAFWVRAADSAKKLFRGSGE